MRRHFFLWLAVIVGLLIRIDVAYNTELWGDESLTVLISEVTPYYDLITQSDLFYDKYASSGYYTLLKVWIDIGFFDAAWFRSLSVLFYFPTVYFIYKTARNISKTKYFGVFTVLIFSVHPLLANQAFQVRPYALSLFLLSGAIYFLFKRTNQLSDLIISACFFSLSVYSAYVAVWPLVVLVLSIFFVNQKMSKKLYVVTGISFLLTIPQQYILVRNIFGKSLIPPGSLAGYEFSFEYIFFHLKSIFGIHFKSHILQYLGAGYFVYLFVIKTKSKTIILFKKMSVLILLIPLLVSSYFFPLFIDRNLVTVSLLTVFILAYFITENLEKKRYVHLIIPLILVTHFFLVSYSKEQFYYQVGLESFSQKIKESDGRVYFLGDVHQHTLTGYYFKKAGLNTNKIHRILDADDMLHTSNKDDLFIIYSNYCEEESNCKMLIDVAKENCIQQNCTWLHPI